MSIKQRKIGPAGEDDHRVIPFRPRDSRAAARFHAKRTDRKSIGPSDLSNYENPQEPDDYRHRMTMNVAAGVATVVLTAFGIWLAMSIADLRRTTDCLLVGRLDCASIPAHHR